MGTFVFTDTKNFAAFQTPCGSSCRFFALALWLVSPCLWFICTAAKL